MNELVCPQCGTPMNQDFGVITCANCGTVVMVDMEGKIQRMDGPSSAEAPREVSYQSTGANELEYQEVTYQPVEPEAPSVGSSNAFEEIEAFANSDLTSSPLSYSLIIEGIDSGEMRKKFAEIISDEKFKFDVNQTLKMIKNGRLEFESMNAVKASLLVNRLRHLPVKISWRQYAYQS